MVCTPTSETTPKALPLLFGATILASSCLLFLVQPLASKLILPWFGGSASVWITCMLFFQTGLLAGYLYAHVLASRFKPKQQAIIHIAVLALSLATLPILPNAMWQPKPGEDPTWKVLAVLATAVGLPYVLLSSTSPLVQSWYAARERGTLPYRYFALSNAGSLLALLAYPVLVEPYLNGHSQAWMWSAAFIVFVFLCIGAAIFAARSPLSPEFFSMADGLAPDTRIAPGVILLWLLLAAAPSTLLLTVTNVLTQNIAPMPLFWVVPLSVYLLTFILAFENARWYKRIVFLPLLLPALWCFANATGPLENQKIRIVIPLLVASLFVSCMSCHGELARLKPSAQHLTTFYLCLSAGGAMGGLFVALFAPHFFSGVYEYPISYVLCAVLMLVVFWRQRPRWTQPRLDLSLWLTAAVATLLLAGYSARQTWQEVSATKVMARNFYGALRVEDFDDETRHVRELNHGTITHGLQILNPSMSHIPTSYYGRDSGIGRTWRTLETAGPLKMGLVGLGAGTLAAYGRGGDTLRFYDINPAVIKIAKTDFTFLRDCPSHIDIVLGDARLSMASEPTQHFDILVIDAFSGDAIPVHLLTREAFQIYWRHLKPDGVLAVHVSNHYLNLAPIVALDAEGIDKRAEKVDNDDDDSQEVYSSTWVLVSNRAGFFESPLLTRRIVHINPSSRIRPWTDDFSNLWQVLKIGG